MNIFQIQRKLKKKLRKRSTPNETKVFLLHVPKTGGTSIDRAIRKHYRHSYSRIRSVASYHTTQMFHGIDIEKAEIDKLLQFREQLVTYEMFNKTQYISGHAPYNRETWDEFSQQYLYATCLRHPVKRYISNYFYDRFKQNDHFNIKQDLSTFLTTPRGKEWGYEYVKYFGGISEEADYDYRSASAIANAKDNLHRFEIVGFLEDLKSFVLQFKQHTGIKLSIVHLRKNPAKNSQVDPETVKKIEAICAPDLELYEYARQEFGVDC